MSILDSHLPALLKAEYAAHLPVFVPVPAKAVAAHHVPVPSDDLVQAFEVGAHEAGLSPGIDWTTIIPRVIVDITTKNFWDLGLLAIQVGPPAFAFIMNVFSQFHNGPPATVPPTIKPA